MKRGEDVLVYDIETLVKDGRPNPYKDELRLFACYSYKTGKYYQTMDKEQTALLIKNHRFLVGFNNISYDNPILGRAGISLEYKTIIDLMVIIKMRKAVIVTDKGLMSTNLMSHSLDYVTKYLGLVDEDSGKKEIDYSVFSKDKWTPEEEKEIKEYAQRDIEVTKKLYEWLEEYFQGFKEFVRPESVKNKSYLTSSIAQFAYKAICKSMGWAETYGEFIEKGKDKIKGGYVAYPAGESFDGDIYCMDWNSLYPHIMIQCNLYGRNKDIKGKRPVWNGGGVWKVDGSYYSDTRNKVGTLIKNWYMDRIKYKDEGDKREYTIKIILNTVYGIMDNQYYALVYDKMGASDCTSLGRQWTKYARKIFRDNGYKIIYTDTDSVYFADVFNNKKKMLSIKDEIVNYIKSTIPFPEDTFDMGIDDEISHMFFFKSLRKDMKKDEYEEEDMDEDDFVNRAFGLLKKNYLYLTKKGSVKIKNLGVRKKSFSPLSRLIFWEHLVPKIKEEKTVKFSKAFLRNLIMKLLQEDITRAALRKEVGPYSQYEATSPTGLQAQISKKYGAGIHFLIPNTSKIGVGKGKSYCTIEEFNEHHLDIEHINLENVWSELEYFLKPIITKNIFDYGKKDEKKNET